MLRGLLIGALVKVTVKDVKPLMPCVAQKARFDGIGEARLSHTFAGWRAGKRPDTVRLDSSPARGIPLLSAGDLLS